jgi:DNA-3-methyladenine glycosylase
MKKILPLKFYQRDTLIVAEELLGKLLILNLNGSKLIGRIVETEAYIGFEDKACHVSRGKTKRNEVMFGRAGHVYIYMIYGMYHCLNIVTEKKDFPAAVLVRAIEPIQGLNKMKKNRKQDNIYKLTNGPGKLCQAMKIDRKLNGEKINSIKIHIKDDEIGILSNNIMKTKRVGVDYAGESAKLPWRFYIKNSRYISQI